MVVSLMIDRLRPSTDHHLTPSRQQTKKRRNSLPAVEKILLHSRKHWGGWPATLELPPIPRYLQDVLRNGDTTPADEIVLSVSKKKTKVRGQPATFTTTTTLNGKFHVETMDKDGSVVSKLNHLSIRHPDDINDTCELRFMKFVIREFLEEIGNIFRLWISEFHRHYIVKEEFVVEALEIWSSKLVCSKLAVRRIPPHLRDVGDSEEEVDDDEDEEYAADCSSDEDSITKMEDERILIEWDEAYQIALEEESSEEVESSEEEEDKRGFDTPLFAYCERLDHSKFPITRELCSQLTTEDMAVIDEHIGIAGYSNLAYLLDNPIEKTNSPSFDAAFPIPSNKDWWLDTYSMIPFITKFTMNVRCDHSMTPQSYNLLTKALSAVLYKIYNNKDDDTNNRRSGVASAASAAATAVSACVAM